MFVIEENYVPVHKSWNVLIKYCPFVQYTLQPPGVVFIML